VETAIKPSPGGSDVTTAGTPTPSDDYWPVYFAAEPVRARNFELARGELFIVQRKDAIRNYLRSFVPNIDTVPLSKVKYLKMLRVPPKAYAEIIEKHATYEQSVGILRRLTRTP
jgi:hypothetical protein